MENLPLNKNEFNPYFKTYIDKTEEGEIVAGLTHNLESAVANFKNLPESKHCFSYAAGKWTVNDIMLHLIDTERVFCYRALRIARGDTTEMVGFDQDLFVLNAQANKRPFSSILNEFISVRRATISMFESFGQSELLNIGNASGSQISVRAIGYIITGHVNHHLSIIKERYI